MDLIQLQKHMLIEYEHSCIHCARVITNQTAIEESVLLCYMRDSRQHTCIEFGLLSVDRVSVPAARQSR